MIHYTKGDQVGELIFIRELKRHPKNDRRMGQFKCRCGKRFKTMIQSARHNRTTTCGCGVGRNEKINRTDISNINNMIWNDGLTLQKIADKYGVSTTTIFNIKMERTYKNVA